VRAHLFEPTSDWGCPKLAGAVKNVMAIAPQLAMVSARLQRARRADYARVAEISARIKLVAPETFMGLAGRRRFDPDLHQDLLRNRNIGLQLARTCRAAGGTAGTRPSAEGVYTARAVTVWRRHRCRHADLHARFAA